jgi:hypothetical protein
MGIAAPTALDAPMDVPEAPADQKPEEMMEQARRELSRIRSLEPDEVDTLIRHGFRSAQELFDAEPYEVAAILNITEEDAEMVVQEAEQVLDALIMEEAEKRQANRGQGDRAES